ncbi:hypothetical protein ABLN72_02865 [Mycobacterium tuberculosis]
MFNLQASQHFHCFRIYRETLSRFSCLYRARLGSWWGWGAAHVPTGGRG